MTYSNYFHRFLYSRSRLSFILPILFFWASTNIAPLQVEISYFINRNSTKIQIIIKIFYCTITSTWYFRNWFKFEHLSVYFKGSPADTSAYFPGPKRRHHLRHWPHIYLHARTWSTQVQLHKHWRCDAPECSEFGINEPTSFTTNQWRFLDAVNKIRKFLSFANCQRKITFKENF